MPSVREALRSLAIAYRRDLDDLQIIGVTGSNGKTTVVRLIHAALSGAGFRGTHAQKSENNDLGVPLTILNASPTDDYLVCEIGTNAPGEIADLASLSRPNIGVITSIGRAHIERLGSVAGIAAEKAQLVRAVPAHGVSIVTADSPELDHELSETGGGAIPSAVVRVGVSPRADRTIDAIEPESGGTRFRIGDHRPFVPLPGTHNAINAGLALVVAEACGADPARAAAGLAGVVPPSMRLERSVVGIGGGLLTLINDAYNANPESARAALAMLGAGELDPAGGAGGQPRRVAILGDMLEMGEHTDAVHREVLGYAAGLDGVDLVMCIGPAFAAAARGTGIRALHSDDWTPDAIESLRDGDVVLLKGSRGMRLERLVEALGDEQRRGAGSAGKVG